MNAVVAASGKHFVRPAAGDNRIPIVAGGDGIVARAQTEICRTLRPGEVLPFVAECQVAGQVLGGDVAVRKPDRLNAVIVVPPVFVNSRACWPVPACCCCPLGFFRLQLKTSWSMPAQIGRAHV